MELAGQRPERCWRASATAALWDDIGSGKSKSSIQNTRISQRVNTWLR